MSKKKVFVALGILILCIIVAASILKTRNKGASEELLTWKVERGDMVIDIVETGSLEAKDSKVIECEVEGQSRIISIVEEGSIISASDVLNKRVLVELDSSDLRKKLDQDAITVQSASASYTDAKESYHIRVKQNESDLKAAELKVKFGRMDLQKYIGKELADKVIDESSEMALLVNHPNLGGDALQKKRKLETDIRLSEEEGALARDKLNWTIKLEEKGYETAEKRRADELALERQRVRTDETKTALELFLTYEFPKEVEKLLSDYQEAVREMDRTEAKCRSEIAKSQARLTSEERQLNSANERYTKTEEQIEKCTMVAPQPGLVVYATEGWWREDSMIREGAMVRERQAIIRIPNTNIMIARAKVHESMISRVGEKYPAKVRVEALTNSVFDATVEKVAVLPSSQSRWMNPNLKLFDVDVLLGNTPPDLKPGMSAEVRIIIKELDDVIMVPIQSIASRGEQRVCFVMTALGPKEREVEVGEYNDKFIEIKSGLDTGERVVLNATTLLEEGAEQFKARKVKEVDRESIEKGTPVAQIEQEPTAVTEEPQEQPAPTPVVEVPQPVEGEEQRASRRGPRNQ